MNTDHTMLLGGIESLKRPPTNPARSGAAFLKIAIGNLSMDPLFRCHVATLRGMVTDIESKAALPRMHPVHGLSH